MAHILNIKTTMYKKSNKSFAKWCHDAASTEVLKGRGQNIIPPPERESLWLAYLEKFKDPIIIVLIVVFFFSVMLSAYEIVVMNYSWSVMFEPIGVLVALLLATGVGFIFEVKAGREFDILNKVKDSRPVKVLRKAEDGHGNPCPPMIPITWRSSYWASRSCKESLME